MSEVVVLAHADHRIVREHDVQRFLRKPVVAAVVGHLEHLHTVQVTRSGDTSERGMLGIAREERIEAAPPHPEHHARVVGAQFLPDLPGGPHHLDGRRAEPPRVPRRDAPHRPRCQRPRLAALRGELPGGDAGNRGPADVDHTTQTGDASCVIVVRMREHQHIHGSHTFTRQCAPEHGLVRAGVHEHGPPAVTHEDRIALADVEHGDRHLA